MIIVLSESWKELQPNALNCTTGFATITPSQSLQFAFNETSIQYAIGAGALTAAFNYPNAASYAAVFDQ